MSNSIAARQDARQIRRIAVRRSAIHGRGVFALRQLHAEEVLVEYAGERVDWTIAASRPPADPDHPDLTYFFDIGDGTVIDGAAGGNSSRWINHSCAPNCEAVDYGGRIFICALRTISEGEELSIDYGLMVDGRITRALRERFACLCGAPNCRGTLLALRTKKRRSAHHAHAEPAVGTQVSQASPPTLAPPDIRVVERPEERIATCSIVHIEVDEVA